MIQKDSLEKITVKSLQNTDNTTNKNFTQSDANFTNNPKKIVRNPNKLRQSLSTNRYFSESQSTMHKDMQLYKTYLQIIPFHNI